MIVSLIAVLISFIPIIEEYNSNLPFYIIIFLFFCKDLFYKNGSVGKKIMNLEIEISSANKITVFSRKFLRNVPLLIWPIELLLVIIYRKRLGDYLFKTNVKEIG